MKPLKEKLKEIIQQNEGASEEWDTKIGKKR